MITGALLVSNEHVKILGYLLSSLCSCFSACYFHKVCQTGIRFLTVVLQGDV